MFDAKPAEITVDDEFRMEAVSAARGLGFPTDGTLTMDEALADVWSVVTARNPLQSVLEGTALSGSFKPSSGWTNLGTCSMISLGAISLTACDLGGGETLDGSVSYGVGHFQADVTDTPHLIGTYESRASLETTGSHVGGTGRFAVDLVPAAAPPNGLHEVYAIDIDVGFDAGCLTSGSIRLTVSSNQRQGTSSLEVDFGPDCGEARFYP